MKDREAAKKSATTALIGGGKKLITTPRKRPFVGDMRVSKEKVQNFLNSFVEEYQKITKTDIPEHYERFPLWVYPVRVVAGISPSLVYVYITRDNDPVETVVEVYDNTNFHKLGKVMDALEQKRDFVTSVLGLKSSIFRNIRAAHESQFTEEAARSLAQLLVRKYYKRLSENKEIEISKHSEQPLPPYAPPLKFLQTSLAVEEIKNQIEKMLSRAKSEILISGWLDTTFLRILQKKKESGVAIRILTKKPDDRSPMPVKTAYRQIVTIGDVRRNSLLHFRLVMCDKKELFISSSDLTTHCMTQNFEAGIWTTSPQILSHAIGFFEKVWGDNNTKNVNEEFVKAKRSKKKRS